MPTRLSPYVKAEYSHADTRQGALLQDLYLFIGFGTVLCIFLGIIVFWNLFDKKPRPRSGCHHFVHLNRLFFCFFSFQFYSLHHHWRDQ